MDHNPNIKRVKGKYQSQLVNGENARTGTCVICGREIEKGCKDYYSTVDYVAPMENVSYDEFHEFAEKEVGSGFMIVTIGNICINHIVEQ